MNEQYQFYHYSGIELKEIHTLRSQIKNKVKIVGRDRGVEIDDLVKATNQIKGTIRKQFLEWIQSKEFEDQSKRMYSPSIAHLFIYPISGMVKPVSVTKIKI